MKIAGYVFILGGITLLLYVSFKYFSQNPEVRSPVPEEKGVKVIYVTPSK